MVFKALLPLSLFSLSVGCGYAHRGASLNAEINERPGSAYAMDQVPMHGRPDIPGLRVYRHPTNVNKTIYQTLASDPQWVFCRL